MNFGESNLFMQKNFMLFEQPLLKKRKQVMNKNKHKFTLKA